MAVSLYLKEGTSALDNRIKLRNIEKNPITNLENDEIYLLICWVCIGRLFLKGL